MNEKPVSSQPKATHQQPGRQKPAQQNQNTPKPQPNPPAQGQNNTEKK
jgi:hypothetical protein